MSRVLPILFNTEMTRAILDGRKTVTRRVVKDLPECKFDCLDTNPEVCYDGDLEKTGTLKGLWATFEACGDYAVDFPMHKARYKVGDILYVRETWKSIGIGYVYKMDWERQGIEDITKWRPSIHMPKKAARIFLKVTDVRVERLQDITEEQVIKEGVKKPHHNGYLTAVFEVWIEKIKKCISNTDARYVFSILWNSTVKEEWQKFESNPYVWVIEFERCEKPIE